MAVFLIKRLGAMIGVLFSLSVLVFLLQRVGNSDPVRAYLGANASAEAVARTREDLGLNQSLPKQYWDFLTGIFRGDLGISYSTKRPVVEDLASRVPATIELAFWALAFAVIIALVLAGVYTRRGRVAAVVRFVFFSAASAPSFLLATLGLVLFFGYLGWLPAGGRTSIGPSVGPTGMYVFDGIWAGDIAYALDAITHLLLPALAASLGPGIALARMLADGLKAATTSGYARTARSLGLGEREILMRHSLRNASSPAISLLGVQAGMMLSSLVVVEQIFSWNGLGQYLTRAISSTDYPAVAAVSLILGLCYVLVNTLVDLSLAAVDPRVRLT